MQKTPLEIPVFKPNYGDEEREAVSRVLDSGYLNEGDSVREFEFAFAKYVGAKYCILVPSGALSLYLALKPLVNYRDNWFIPDYYSIFASNALQMVGKLPLIFDDYLSLGYYLDSNALLPIHVNGRTSPIDSTHSIIEDCGQAPFMHSRNLVSCYSFHSTKHITCGGIGGAVCTDSKDIHCVMSAIKDHGRTDRAMNMPVTDNHQFWGTNLKMSDINAAFGLVQLKNLPRKLDRFTKIYLTYRDLLGDRVEWLEGNPYWRVDCLVEKPDKVIQELKKEGMGAMRFYRPTHMQNLFKRDDDLFPNTMHLYNHGIYLPSYTTITDEEIKKVCDVIIRSL